MNSKSKVSVIILTYNEAENIVRSIQNTISWAHQVIVLDSYSEDNTVEIANSLGAKVVQRKFDNYSAQRNYAIKELQLETDWILFLDADEYLSEDLKKEINSELVNPTSDGYYLKRRFYFDGRWVKWGGYYPIWILRLFKKEKGLFQREINEHLVLDGRASKLKNYFTDESFVDFKNTEIYDAKFGYGFDCLIRSLLFCMSDTYRKLDENGRNSVGSYFRRAFLPWFFDKHKKNLKKTNEVII